MSSPSPSRQILSRLATPRALRRSSMRRYKTWQLLVILLLAVFVPMATIIGLAQEPTPLVASKDVDARCKGSHKRKDFYQNVRYLEPSTVLEIVGDRINYAVSGEGIELGSLNLETEWTVVPKHFATNHKGCFGIVYCQKHLVALQIDAIDGKHCQLQKH
jgi:hypothetical protein